MSLLRILAILLLVSPAMAAQGYIFPGTPLAPYAGSSAVQFGYQQGAVLPTDSLAFEWTQPWTIMAAINTRQTVQATAIIYTNVTTMPVYPGYECILASGVLRVRVIHDISANNYIDVAGTTNVYDGKWHMVACSYDGSGQASGVKLYVDGVPEITSIIKNTLSGSIVSTPQTPIVGNQANHLDFVMTGVIDEFSISNVARSEAYIAQHSTPQSLPPIDGDISVYYNFDEDAGVSASDASGHGITATLTLPTQWFPQ